MAVRSLGCHWNLHVKSSWLQRLKTRPSLRLLLQAFWADSMLANTSGEVVGSVLGVHCVKLKIASSKTVDATTGGLKFRWGAL